eukprot:scaffold47423_cov71-Phaeocystis_antarctica.AAC.1
MHRRRGKSGAACDAFLRVEGAARLHAERLGVHGNGGAMATTRGLHRRGQAGARRDAAGHRGGARPHGELGGRGWGRAHLLQHAVQRGHTAEAANELDRVQVLGPQP